VMGKKWIGYGRLLAEVSSEVYKLPKRAERPWVTGSPGPGSLVLSPLFNLPVI